MEITLETVVFYFLAVFITVCSILTVTTRRMVRSATYLLFTLFGTAGIYFLLGYTFLGSVQIMVYAGGIVVLYVFSILLTSGEGDRTIDKLKRSKLMAGLGATVGVAIGVGVTSMSSPPLPPHPASVNAIAAAATIAIYLDLCMFSTILSELQRITVKTLLFFAFIIPRIYLNVKLSNYPRKFLPIKYPSTRIPRTIRYHPKALKSCFLM